MAVSFKTDILPLFTQMDIEHMSEYGVHLDDYDYMSRNPLAAYQQVSQGYMPPPESGEEKWPPDRVKLYKSWMDAGCPP